MKEGTWLRNKETGESVVVVEAGAFVTRYQNSDVDGEVQTAKLEEHFDVLESKPEDADDF